MSSLDTRAIDAADLPEEPFPEVEQGFRVRIAEEAFDSATARGAVDMTREVGGVLVGRICKDAGGPYVLVEDTIDALHAEEKGAELTFTHATWDHINGVMDREHQGKRIVGWFHTHPGFGVFLSDRDQFIHRSFFNLPYQCALVYDPKSREHGLFAWKDSEPVRCRRYWIGRREFVWEEKPAPADEAAKPEAAATEAKKPEEAASGSAVQGEMPGLLFTGVVLLLIGGLAGWLIGGASGGDEAQVTQAKLQAAQLRGVQAAVDQMNVEVLALLRESVLGGATQQGLDESLEHLEAGLSELHPEKAPTPEALGRLQLGRKRIQVLRDARIRAETSLLQLETVSRMTSLDPRELQRLLMQHRRTLGRLCLSVAEMARAGGDVKRAERMLRMAMEVDSKNAPQYERKLQDLRKAESD